TWRSIVTRLVPRNAARDGAHFPFRKRGDASLFVLSHESGADGSLAHAAPPHGAGEACEGGVPLRFADRLLVHIWCLGALGAGVGHAGDPARRIRHLDVVQTDRPLIVRSICVPGWMCNDVRTRAAQIDMIERADLGRN